jgi:hypothetical protein
VFVLVLAAEADETRQAITFLIVCLVGIAVLLSLLTVWYWRYTSPSRRQAELLAAASAMDSVTVDSVTADSVTVDPGPADSVTAGREPVGPVSVDPVPVDPVTVDFVAAGPEPVDPDTVDFVPVGKAPADSGGERRALVVPSGRRRIEVGERGRPPSQPHPVDSEPTDDESKQSRVPVPVGAASTATSDGPGGDGLSDDAWAAVMKSAFEKLQT